MNHLGEKISNQIDAIQYFIEKMDIEMIDAILDNDLKYQEFEKHIFINKLKNAFITFIERGDTHLLSFDGRCNSCDKTKTGFTFVGNKSKNYMSIIFYTADNRIKDLLECNYFINNISDLELEDRIFIDEEFLPF